ncbi:hypothetical protein AGOR_G00222690 [Albula goreensis]|uniref:Ig-like domain-containing protein n=1 Tax=Albula goreensis TaxID=1534307 RepID=A0A8T3CG80_9TELE|nr:hypothetical protein AGOR_G00222690 [Albula goreensis]
MAETWLRFVLLALYLCTWASGSTNIIFQKIKVGESITVSCSTAHIDLDGAYVYWSLPTNKVVVNVDARSQKMTADDGFKERVKRTGSFPKFSFTISTLAKEESGLYWCEYHKFNEETERTDKFRSEGPILMVLVEGSTNIIFQKIKVGESITVSCSTAHADLDGAYVYWSRPTNKDVVYVDAESQKVTEDDGFEGRVKKTGSFPKFSLTISTLAKEDSGLYWCEYNKFKEETRRLDKFQSEGLVLMVLVEGVEPNQHPTGETPRTLLQPSKGEQNFSGEGMTMIIVGMCAGTIILCCIVLSLMAVPKVKRLCEKGYQREYHPHGHESIYEDMRQNCSV